MRRQTQASSRWFVRQVRILNSLSLLSSSLSLTEHKPTHIVGSIILTHLSPFMEAIQWKDQSLRTAATASPIVSLIKYKKQSIVRLCQFLVYVILFFFRHLLPFLYFGYIYIYHATIIVRPSPIISIIYRTLGTLSRWFNQKRTRTP